MSLLVVMVFIVSSVYAFEFSLTPSYSYTLTKDIEKVDYLGARMSFLIPTEDNKSINYGPYVGIFYNYKLLEQGHVQEKAGISLGLHMKYCANIIQDFCFVISAYGGVHTEDLFKNFNTEIAVNAGLGYNIYFFTVGYETRYYPDEFTVNYFPITIGVSFQF
jgi:hypothetical protein